MLLKLYIIVILVQFAINVQRVHLVIFGLDPSDMLVESERSAILNFKDLGNAEFNSQHYEASLKLYQQALEKLMSIINNENTPDNQKLVSSLYYNMALIYSKTNRPNESLEACNKAIDQCEKKHTCTGYVKPYLKRAELFINNGEYDFALADYKQAYDLMNTNLKDVSYLEELAQKIKKLEAKSRQKHAAEKKKNYYEVLGVNKNASPLVIKKAYRRMSLKYHPDKNESASKYTKKLMEERFKEINEAYTVLSDEKSRAEYEPENPETPISPDQEWRPPKRNSFYSDHMWR